MFDLRTLEVFADKAKEYQSQGASDIANLLNKEFNYQFRVDPNGVLYVFSVTPRFVCQLNQNA